MATNEKKVQIEKELNKCKKLAEELLAGNDPEANNQLIGELIDTHRMGVFYDDDTAIIVADVKDFDDLKKWKMIALAFDKNSKTLKEKDLFGAGDCGAVHNYIKQYLKCIITDVRTVCNHKDSNTPLMLTKGRICIKETGEIIFDTNDTTAAAKELKNDVETFIRKIVADKDIKIVDGEELSKKKSVNDDVSDYIFISKPEADETAESLGYGDAKNFYKMAEAADIFYKTKDNRFSRRVRDSKIKELLGSEQIFGIKKSVFLKYKGEYCDEKEV